MRSKRQRNKQKARHRKKVKAKKQSTVKVWLHGTGLNKIFEV